MSPQSGAARYPGVTGLVMAIFVAISLLTNILGPIIPAIIRSFSLSLTAAALLPFSFFIAYGVMSIPAGALVEAYGEKSVILAAFSLSFAGSLLVASMPGYRTILASVFVVGLAMAVLQVAINPLLRVSGGEDRFAFYCALSQLLFGGASFLSPLLYSYLVRELGSPRARTGTLRLLGALTPQQWPWVSLYWIFAAVSLAMLLGVALFRFPRVPRRDDERTRSWRLYRDLLRKPVVLLYFLSMFVYVGSEQGTANWMSQFLATYHGVNPEAGGAMAVAWFWGLLTAGCGVGLILLRIVDSRCVLVGSTLGALGALSAALFGSRSVAIVAFPAIGLFASVMWPVINSLALNSLAHSHGAFAGILCTGIVGGAIVPLFIGHIGDVLGLRAGLALLYLTFGWILSIGFWARPLISNRRRS